MHSYKYQVVKGSGGFEQLESTVTMLLNDGWELVGGISFNCGYPYQAMRRKTPRLPESDKGKYLGAQDAFKQLDNLT